MALGTIILIVLLVLSCLHITYTVASVPVKNKITGAKQKALAAQKQAEAQQRQAEAQQKQIEQLTIALNNMKTSAVVDALNK